MTPPPWMRVLGALAVLCLHRQAAADCTSDAQCKDGRVCQRGVCAEAAAPDSPRSSGVTCSKDRDCPGAEVCDAGTCQAEATESDTTNTSAARVPPVEPKPAQDADSWGLAGDVAASLLSMQTSSSGVDSDAVEAYELRATVGTRDAHNYGGLGISYVAASSGGGGVLTAIVYGARFYDLGYFSFAIGFGSPTSGPSTLISIQEGEIGIHSGKYRLGFELGVIDGGFENSTLLAGVSLGAGF